MSVPLLLKEHAVEASAGKTNVNFFSFLLSSLVTYHSLSNVPSSVMGFAHLQDTVAPSGAIVEPLPSTARMIPLLLLQVPSRERRRHQPPRLRQANVLLAILEMLTVLTRTTVALSMDIADLASSTAIPQPLTTEIAIQLAMKKLEHAVVSFIAQYLS